MGFKVPPAIFAQVPAGTATKASFWSSIFDVPAQEELAVWQSFMTGFGDAVAFFHFGGVGFLHSCGGQSNRHGGGEKGSFADGFNGHVILLK